MFVTAFFSKNGVPLLAPANAPTIRIRRLDTQALVVTDLPMTEVGDGVFSFDFTLSVLLKYSFRCDGDPTASGQTGVSERYQSGSFDGNCLMIEETWRLLGLDTGESVVRTPTTVDAGSAIAMTLAGDGVTTSTLTRT